MIKKLFGDEILYLHYEYVSSCKTEPSSFDQLFGFLRYRNTKETLRKAAEISGRTS